MNKLLVRKLVLKSQMRRAAMTRSVTGGLTDTCMNGIH
jgi:hypothetical protein